MISKHHTIILLSQNIYQLFFMILALKTLKEINEFSFDDNEAALSSGWNRGDVMCYNNLGQSSPIVNRSKLQRRRSSEGM